jgi:hypothetical protein
MAKYANIFRYPQPKAKAPQLSTQALPTKCNSSKNAKKKEHNADKKEMLQAYAIQVQILQNELESLRTQIANLKSKFSQPVVMPNMYKVQEHGRDLLGHSMASHMMPWLGNMCFLVHTILALHQNLLRFFALPTSRHNRLVWHLKFLPQDR